MTDVLWCGRPATSGDAVASAELRRLLLEVPEYRVRWLQHVQRRRGDDISHTAVARVLSGVDSTGASLESLRDRSRRALCGEVLAPVTLRLFGEAFGFNLPERERLWALLGARQSESPAEGQGMTREREAPVTTLARAIDLQVGADRASWTVRTTLTVQALVDGVPSLPLGEPSEPGEPDELWTAVPLLGCQLENSRVRLPRSLHAGDVHIYAYELSGTVRPEHRRRYVVDKSGPTALAVIQVGFTPPALPARVRWRTWDDRTMTDLRTDHEVVLGPSHRVSWTQQDLVGGVGGFEWTWP